MLFAQGPASVDAKTNPISLLPSGSVLKGVLLPRYDEDRNLVGDLKAEVMTLIDADRVNGENVLIRFYKPDRSLRGKVKLQNATFDQSKSLLYANEPAEITNDNLVARGSGLVYAFQEGRGFLRGPATTWISPTQLSTSMRTSPTTRAAIVALYLASPVISAAPPKFVTEEELAAIKAEAEPMRPRVDEANRSAQAQLSEDRAAAEKASETARSFVKASKIKTIATEEPAETEEAAPLEVNPGPEDTVIKCEGGMYFDSEEGVLVYLKNVTVTDPRFNLSGASELKVFFDKPEPKEKPATEKEESGGLGPTANFGDVKKLVASGAVKILQKSVGGKDPVEASGAILTYDVPKGEIIINGGYPWVKQGSYYARAKQPNLTLSLLNNGDFSTQGEWEMGANLKLNGR